MTLPLSKPSPSPTLKTAVKSSWAALLVTGLITTASAASLSPADRQEDKKTAATVLPLSTAHAINRAGELRMLSQRIVKAYTQIGLKVQPSESHDILEQSLARFEANLNTLTNYARHQNLPDVQFELMKLETQWKKMRGHLNNEPTRQSAHDLSRASDHVLDTAELLTMVVENHSDNPVAHYVNLAGRQRMLSQRISKAYMLVSWGNSSSEIRQTGTSASHEFIGAMQVLKNNPGNTPEVRQELEELELRWNWLQVAQATEGAQSYRLIAAEASEALLRSAQRLTELYEQAAH